MSPSFALSVDGRDIFVRSPVPPVVSHANAG